MPKRKTLKRRNAKRRSMKKKLLMGGGKGYTKYTILDNFNSKMIDEKNKDYIYLFFDKNIYILTYAGILNNDIILKYKNGKKIIENELDNIIANTLKRLRIEIDEPREEYNKLLYKEYKKIQGLSFGIGIFVNNKELYKAKITNPKDYIVIKASITDLRQLYPYLPYEQSIIYDHFIQNKDNYHNNETTRPNIHTPPDMPVHVQSSNVLTPDNPNLSLGDQIRQYKKNGYV